MINIKQKMKEAKKSRNKGFSLVELVICFAILSIVALCIGIMMNSGTKMFVRVNRNINLSYKAQIPMTQMKDYFIDCNGIAQETDDEGNVTTYVTGFDGNKLMVYSYRFVPEDKKIYFSEAEVNTGVVGTAIEQEFVKGVTAFSVDVSEKYETSKISGVEINITVEFGDAQYSKEQTVTFRNSPVYITSDNIVAGESMMSALARAVYNNIREV